MPEGACGELVVRTRIGVRARALFSAILTSSLLLLLVSCGGTPRAKSDPAPVLYPPPPAPPRVQFLTSFRTSADIEKGPSAFERFVLGKERTLSAIQGPWGIAFRDGRAYVCDLKQRTVIVLDLEAREFRSIDDLGAGKLRKPVQCGFDAEGNFYVADRERRQVVCYDPEMRYLRAYGPLDEGFTPVDVVVDGERVYVCDIGNRLVQIFDRSSREWLRSIGDPASLTGPTNIALNRAGECHIVDTIRNRVLVYDEEGRQVRQIGDRGDVVGQFGRAKGIDIDDEGYVYVVDAASEVCQIFTPEGEIALFFGGHGVGPGDLYLPTDVYLAREGFEYFDKHRDPGFQIEYLIFIVSQFGPRLVNVYAFGKSKGYRSDP
ncbi:MAG: 6-bladed beta-propeller [Planctomycetota bacterium]